MTFRTLAAMASAEHWASFALAALVFATVPGPAMLYITAQTLAHGRPVALQAVLGVHIGCYAHVIAATAGLSAALHYLPGLYEAMKAAGAAYLVCLGAVLVWRRVTGEDSVDAGGLAPRRVFRDSALVEVLNPKTVIFFTAFLPQFVDAAADLPVWLQFLILGALINLSVSAVELGVALAAATALSRLQRSRRRRSLMQKLCGAVLIGLGLALAFGQG